MENLDPSSTHELLALRARNPPDSAAALSRTQDRREDEATKAL